MSFNNQDLALAFPASVRNDALRVVSTLPQPSWNSETFSVRVGGETLLIPARTYHDPAQIVTNALTPLQLELLDCLLTRHANGYVREKQLRNIVTSDNVWIPPFVVQLAGEYVFEILDAIRNNLQDLNPQLYREFLGENPALLALTKQRVWSYWDCYHHRHRGEHYAGFEIVKFFESLVGKTKSQKS